MRATCCALLATLLLGCRTPVSTPFDPPPGAEIPSTYPQAAVVSGVVDMPALQASARLLTAIAWQAHEIASLDPTFAAARKAGTAAAAARAGFLGDASAAASALTPLRMAAQSPASPLTASRWSMLQRATVMATTLVSTPTIPIRYEGDRLPDGGYIAVTGDRIEGRLEFQDAGDQALTEEAERSLVWREWMRNVDVAGGRIVTQKTEVIDRDTKKGGKYAGMGVVIWFVRAPGGCTEPMVIQFVKRDVTINGTASPEQSFDWRIDVIPPKSEDTDAKRTRWRAAHPRYQVQRRDPRDATRSYARDFPGMLRTDDLDAVESTWQFRMYLVCCNPFAVLARIDWGFTLRTGSTVNPSTVEELARSPADSSVTWPHMETTRPQDDMFNRLLAGWIADPARSCQTE